MPRFVVCWRSGGNGASEGIRMLVKVSSHLANSLGNRAFCTLSSALIPHEGAHTQNNTVSNCAKRRRPKDSRSHTDGLCWFRIGAQETNRDSEAGPPPARLAAENTGQRGRKPMDQVTGSQPNSCRADPCWECSRRSHRRCRPQKAQKRSQLVDPNSWQSNWSQWPGRLHPRS